MARTHQVTRQQDHWLGMLWPQHQPLLLLCQQEAAAWEAALGEQAVTVLQWARWAPEVTVVAEAIVDAEALGVEALVPVAELQAGIGPTCNVNA